MAKFAVASLAKGDFSKATKELASSSFMVKEKISDEAARVRGLLSRR